MRFWATTVLEGYSLGLIYIYSNSSRAKGALSDHQTLPDVSSIPISEKNLDVKDCMVRSTIDEIALPLIDETKPKRLHNIPTRWLGAKAFMKRSHLLQIP